MMTYRDVHGLSSDHEQVGFLNSAGPPNKEGGYALQCAVHFEFCFGCRSLPVSSAGQVAGAFTEEALRSCPRLADERGQCRTDHYSSRLAFRCSPSLA